MGIWQARDRAIACVERGFHIESNPVDEREEEGQSFRENSGRVKANGKPQISNVANRPHELALRRRLAAAEDDTFQEATPCRKFLTDERPRPLEGLVLEPLKMGIVTISASPWTTLTKNDGCQAPWKIQGCERNEPADNEVAKRCGAIHALVLRERGDVRHVHFSYRD